MRIQKPNVYDEYERMPILFTPFCKIEAATKVFNAIKKSKPKKLYVFSDGWRKEKEGEKEKVEYLRKFIVENIDWDCEVFTKFENKNLGVRFGLEAAFDWFFENEEMGIILEDDCLPAPSFFRFCSELLIKYKDEEKIFLINGTNETAKNTSSNSYSFKKITDFAEEVAGIWGWATWRRAWKKHDKKMSFLEKYKKQCDTDCDTLDYEEYLKNARLKFFTKQMELILAGKNSTWDIQLKFSILINDGLIIVPNCNLVMNIGYGVSDVAHGGFEYIASGTLPTGDFLFPIEHKSQISANPLTAKEYIRAAFMPILRDKEFWDVEEMLANKIVEIHNFLAKSDISNEQKYNMKRQFSSKILEELLKTSLHFKEYPKAQKYLYLALTKSLFQGEDDKDICAKCRKCIAICPTKSFNLFKENGKIVIGIDRKTCEYCWNCMKNCSFVNPK